MTQRRYPLSLNKPDFHLIITKEMEEGRARMEAYKNKVQPYPGYPEPSEIPPSPLIGEEERYLLEPVWTRRQYDKVQQLQSEVEGWRQKHAEMMKTLDKLTPKKDEKSVEPF